MKNHVGLKVRKLRELRNFTQSFLADSLGLSQQAYSKIEKNGRLTVEQLEKIASLLGVETAFILTFDEKQWLSKENAVPVQESKHGNSEVMQQIKGIQFYEQMIHLMKKEIDCLYAIAFPEGKPA